MSDLLDKTVSVTTADICAAMRATYCQPEWALFFEVANGTGANARRHADAVAMNMYPSRGLAVHGFEFKASKSDWRRELSNPQKAEEIAQYCDMWSVVTGPGIVAPHELPLSWGLIEVVNGKLRTKIAATKKEAKTLTRSFVAAILRGHAKADEAQIKRIVDKQVEEIRSRDREHIDRQIKTRTQEAQETIEKYSVIADAMKDYRFRYSGEKDFARAVNLAMILNLDGSYGGLTAIAASLKDLAARASDALETVSQVDP